MSNQVNNNTNSEEEIQFFTKSIQDYLKLEEEIKTIEAAVKNRKEKRKNLSETILTFLQENEISNVNMQGNFSGKQMRCSTIKKKTALTEKTISKSLVKYFNDPEEANKVLEAIFSNRSEVEVQKLKLGASNKVNKSAQLSELLENDSPDEIPDSMKYLYTKVN